MITIWKYPLRIMDEQTIDMPQYARIIKAGLDPDNIPCIWAEVNTDQKWSKTKTIFIHGTGHPIGKTENYLGTFIQGPFVWHIYEK